MSQDERPVITPGKRPPPPPDRQFHTPGCPACEVIFGWLVIAIVFLLIYMGWHFYEMSVRLKP